jgi:hypothetical protein
LTCGASSTWIVSSGGPGEDRLEVCRMGDVVLDRPAVEVGGQGPLLAREVAHERHEFGARDVPDLDELDEPGVRSGVR